MAEINWTEEAHVWLEDIFEYVAQENPEAAGRVAMGIYERVQILKDFPALGYRYQDISDREVKILIYGHYRIAYLIKPGSDIDTLGVFHGALDIRRYFI